MTGKRILAYKAVVVLFILLYIMMSCFPCVELSTWFSILVEHEPSTGYSNNISVVMATALTMQIVLMVLDRPLLQLLAGIIGLFPGIMLPLTAALINHLNHSMVGTHTDRAILPLGWIVTIFSWVLLGLDIWIAVMIERYEVAAAKPAGNNAEEREDV